MESGAARAKRLRAVVSGRVQGVGFRYFVLDRASDLRLTGFVRNRLNGDVEVVAEGDEGALEAFLVALKQGPRASRVEGVSITWLPATGEFKRFEITSSR
jgi:acylphosphatase